MLIFFQVFGNSIQKKNLIQCDIKKSKVNQVLLIKYYYDIIDWLYSVILIYYIMLILGINFSDWNSKIR